VAGVVHATFKEACQAMGFLDDDNEWIDCVNEAATTTILNHFVPL